MLSGRRDVALKLFPNRRKKIVKVSCISVGFLWVLPSINKELGVLFFLLLLE